MNVYHITYIPDTQTASVYFLGCNFACKGCIRKKGGWDIHLKKGLIKENIQRLALDEVVEALSRQPLKKVIFLGGEPSIDPEFGKLANRLLSQYGTCNVLLTNGYKLPELDGISEVCLSIKAFTSELHRNFTGRSNRAVLENFKHLSKNNRIILRAESVLIPGYIDLDEIESIAKFIANCNPEIPYRIDGYVAVDNAWRTPTEEELITSVEIACKYLKNVTYLWAGTKLKHKVMEVV